MEPYLPTYVLMENFGQNAALEMKRFSVRLHDDLPLPSSDSRKPHLRRVRQTLTLVGGLIVLSLDRLVDLVLTARDASLATCPLPGRD